MPSQRRVKVFALLAALAVLSFLYLSSAGSSTRSSPFYTNTASALDAKNRAAQEAIDLETHQKIQEAHEAAAKEKETVRDPDLPAVPGQSNEKEQKPFAVDVEEAAGKAQKIADTVKEGAKDAVHGVVDGEKSVAGRKMIKGEKGLKDDGVAKVGNTGAKPTKAADEQESEEDHKTEVELNSILKKSPSTLP